MKLLIIILAITTIGTASLCEMCIKTSEIIQKSLIKITPTFVA